MTQAAGFTDGPAAGDGYRGPVSAAAGRPLLPIVGAIGFLILAIAIYWVWDHPQIPDDSPQTRALADRVAGLEQRAPADLMARVTALEQRAPPDLGALNDRLAALEKRAAAPAASASSGPPPSGASSSGAVPPDTASRTELTQLATRLDAVGARADQLAARMQAADQSDAEHLDTMEAKIAGLAKQDAAAAALAEKVSASAQRMDALDARIVDLAKKETADAALAGPLAASTQRLDTLDGRLAGLASQQAADARLADAVKALEQRIGALEKTVGTLPALTDRAAQLARLQAAAAALDAGEPVGTLPGAPPELARYATARPPTLAALKLAFPAAMQAAEEASIPSPAQANLLGRMWDRVQGLVVVRQGDSVVVGNPAAGVLARAARSLDASDLAGAVQTVSGLTGPAAAAMANWLQSAKDLLAARQAMAALAAHA